MKIKKRTLFTSLVAAALCVFATGALAGDDEGKGGKGGKGSDPTAVSDSASTLALLGVSMLGIAALWNKFARRNESKG